MSKLIRVIKVILQLLPYIEEIIAFLEGLKDIKKNSGNEVAKVIARDAADIAANWQDYLTKTRKKEKGGVKNG